MVFSVFTLIGVLHVIYCAAAFSWYGMSPEPMSPQNVSIFSLYGIAQRGDRIETIILREPNEVVAVDSFRCRPYGTFCVFTTSNGTDSWLYNISMPNGGVQSRTNIPNAVVHNLHVDMATGAAFSVALRPQYAMIVRIFDQKTTPVIDLSAFMSASSEIHPGYTTQCSNINTMWVTIHNASRAGVLNSAYHRSLQTEKDNDDTNIVIHVDLTAKKILNVTSVKEPIMTSLWASCNDRTNVNKLGGTAIIAGGTSVAYGTYDDLGNFIADRSMVIPSQTPPLQLTALLSQPVGFDYFFALYPKGAYPGGPQTSGKFVFGKFVKDSSIDDAGSFIVAEAPYYLTGAARIT